MRKVIFALFAAAVLTASLAWGEGKSGKTNTSCADTSACCCSKSCPK
jgi:hypothetical protein